MSNTTGNYTITLERHMRAYDRLPARAREIVRNALYNYACPPFATTLRKWPELLAGEGFLHHVVDNDMVNARQDIRREWGLEADAYREAQPRRRKADYFDATRKF